ncbi:serine/threonine transporter SstT [Clostridium taeniosporum]|uniref:Serine/threonine transporter SstT n=1 Tax=Clostridium taeniosporum TaxID=394958 RepID=A0A1D7XPD0_9CLOT|nr:serine/threonine transporter SstT [Clostridium taeniosporum]AOR25178.1 serine/threonine transporter SstT [Clostridium taeniosporum]
MKKLIEKWNNISLIKRIIFGLILGIIFALTIPDLGAPISIFGSLFVGALKAIAPILVFFLVIAALSQYKEGKKTNMKSVILLYLLGTLSAGVVGVIGSFLFPVKLVFTTSVDNLKPPSGVGEVLNNLLMNIVSNPVSALSNANYIGILFWAVILGLALKNANEGSKKVIANLSDAISQVVRWIINLAPFGIMGLVFDSISKQGVESLIKYGQLILVLVGCMAFFALVINPIITFILIHKNPYPLVIKCLKNSGITAFFTRSSAANIPVNMALCKELGLNEDTYSISIPLGATINMGGAALTISVLTLAATNTLGITVDIGTAIILVLLAAVSACGTSGVAGGSLLLVPLACSLFGIPNDIAMQVVGVGFIIGVIQDSCETALNSSTDVLYTAVAEFAQRRKLKP